LFWYIFSEVVMESADLTFRSEDEGHLAAQTTRCKIPEHKSPHSELEPPDMDYNCLTLCALTVCDERAALSSLFN
jgi:hypothetical protein